MPTNLTFNSIKELRILPRNGCFYAEFVYEKPDVETNLNKSNVLGIDHGLDNWLSCVSKVCSKPFKAFTSLKRLLQTGDY